MTGPVVYDQTIPLSLVAHTSFCPRRAWLESVGERVDSAQIQVGKSAHRRVDEARGAGRGERRSVDVHHAELGLIGRCDVVADTEFGVHLTEFKATPVKLAPTVTEAMRTQLALQRMCLTASGHSVDSVSVFFTTHHRKVDVELGEDDDRRAVELVAETRRVVSSSSAPPPLEDSPKCQKCSHVGVCLPDERRYSSPARRVVVADPENQVVHLATPGSRVHLSRGRLVVSKSHERLASIPIERVQGVVVHGNVDLSSALLRELMWRDLTTVWCSGTGRVYGWARPSHSANGAIRVRQHVVADHGDLGFSREFVATKIANQATLLRRNGTAPGAVSQLRRLQKLADSALTTEPLLGVEGEAAAVYFGAFLSMLNPGALAVVGPSWPGRSGRAAGDPLNAALNYVYALVTAETIRAIVACGLDPHAGFLHSPRRNKPALALDLMEEFRAPVADSVVVRALNNGEIGASDFTSVFGTSRLTEKGRKALIGGFEHRMTTEFTHPLFGYKVTWRRAMEVQARLVLGVLDGSQSRYRGIRTR